MKDPVDGTEFFLEKPRLAPPGGADWVLYLRLPQVPKGGRAERALGFVRDRILLVERRENHWLRHRKGWALAYFPIKEHEAFHFDVVHAYCTLPGGRQFQGFLCAAKLSEFVCHSKAGFERQLIFRAADLLPTMEQARKLAATAKAGKAQAALFPTEPIKKSSAFAEGKRNDW